MATPTVPDAPALITNGSTAEKVFRYLLNHPEGTSREIAYAIGATRSAAWNALQRLRGYGVTRELRREASEGASGSPEVVWGLVSAYADFKMPGRAVDDQPAVRLTLVQRAMAAQPPLATVWMESRA